MSSQKKSFRDVKPSQRDVHAAIEILVDPKTPEAWMPAKALIVIKAAEDLDLIHREPWTESESFVNVSTAMTGEVPVSVHKPSDPNARRYRLKAWHFVVFKVREGLIEIRRTGRAVYLDGKCRLHPEYRLAYDKETLALKRFFSIEFDVLYDLQFLRIGWWYRRVIFGGVLGKKRMFPWIGLRFEWPQMPS